MTSPAGDGCRCPRPPPQARELGDVTAPEHDVAAEPGTRSAAAGERKRALVDVVARDQRKPLAAGFGTLVCLSDERVPPVRVMAEPAAKPQ